MGEIILEKNHVSEFLHDTFNSYKTTNKDFKDDDYHHNTDYKLGKSVIKHGILSLEDLNKLKIRNLNEKELEIANDITSHINGNNGVSLSVVGLKDLYRDEEEYYPFSPSLLDILITRDIKAGRSTVNYGNEYVSFESIKPTSFESVDVRLLKLIENAKTKEDVMKVVSYYNYLNDIMKEIKKEQLDISVREMSNSNLTLDIDKMIKAPKILVKKR